LVFKLEKEDYALYVALGHRVDTVGVWGSNPHAPTNPFNNLTPIASLSVTPNYSIREQWASVLGVCFNPEERQHLEVVMREHYSKSARDICTALMEHATKDDDHLRQIGEEDHIDDKTVFIIKRE